MYLCEYPLISDNNLLRGANTDKDVWSKIFADCCPRCRGNESFLTLESDTDTLEIDRKFEDVPGDDIVMWDNVS